MCFNIILGRVFMSPGQFVAGQCVARIKCPLKPFNFRATLSCCTQPHKLQWRQSQVAYFKKESLVWLHKISAAIKLGRDD